MIVMVARKIELKVAEMLSQVDVGRGMARIDTSTMRSLGIFPGDIVEVEGSKRKSPLIIDNAYPSDVGLGLIRMDGITRRNGGLKVGDLVKVKKAHGHDAKKVALAPVQRGVKFQNIEGDHVCYCDKCNKWGKHMITSQKVEGGFKVLKCSFCGGTTLRMMMRSSLNKVGLGRAVTKGDVIQLNSLAAKSRGRSSPFYIFDAGETKFVVVNTSPAGPVKITDTTEVEFMQKRRPLSKK